MYERIKHSEVVDEPVEAVYERWRRFEEFPQIADRSISVTRTQPAHLQWRMGSAGSDAVWETNITDEVPARRIVWRSIGEFEHSGKVEFEAQAPGRTLVTLDMRFELPQRAVDAADDLQHLKQMVSLAAAELGAGEVRE